MKRASCGWFSSISDLAQCGASVAPRASNCDRSVSAAACCDGASSDDHDCHVASASSIAPGWTTLRPPPTRSARADRPPYPPPQPGDVTPEELYPDALEEAEQARENYAFALEAQCDDFLSPKPAG